MRTTQNKFFTVIAVFAFALLSHFTFAQPPGLCTNIQNCNDENFSATEDDDDYAGEFYNSHSSHAVNVVHSEIGRAYNVRSFFGKAKTNDWWGVGARFEAGFCAIEAITISDGTDHSSEIPPGHLYPFYGTLTTAQSGGANSVHLGLMSIAGSVTAPNTLSFGVYSTVYGPGQKYAGFFDGDVLVTGNLTAFSDRKLKKNVKSLNSALLNLNQLQAKSYEFKTGEFEKMNLPEGEQFGFIAQELEEVFPQLVRVEAAPSFDPNDTKNVKIDHFKSVNYIGLIPIMVEAINEQTAIIEEKDNKINTLETQLTQLLERVENIEATLRIESSDVEHTIPSLKQNQPNPTNGTTTIGFVVPVQSKSAMIKIYTMAGQEIQSLPLNQRGANSIEISLNTFQAGTYLYSLVIDGNTLETKKMIVNK